MGHPTTDAGDMARLAIQQFCQAVVCAGVLPVCLDRIIPYTQHSLDLIQKVVNTRGLSLLLRRMCPVPPPYRTGPS